MSLTAKPKVSSQYRKRQAGHHRQSKKYLKTYWPYLPLLLVIAAVVSFSYSPGNKSSNVLGAEINLTNVSLLNATNLARESNHDSSLSLDNQLDKAAQTKANSMAQNNYWSHTSPSGETAWMFIINSGYRFNAAGENLAYGLDSASSVLSAWMNSPDHRANVLNSNYSDVGFGVAESNNYLGQGPKIIVVADYGQPSSTNLADSALVNQPSVNNVSKLQLITGDNSIYVEIVASFIVGLAIATFILRHGLYLKRLVSSSERFIVHRPLLDASLAILAIIGVILLHSAGHIG